MPKTNNKLYKFKILFINILYVIILLIILEIISCFYLRTSLFNINNHSINKIEKIKQIYKNLTKELEGQISSKEYFDEDEFRPIIDQYPNSKKGSILLIGCSYTYGVLLENNEAFHSYLSNYTKRNVYNIALPGIGPREILYMLRDKEFIDPKIQNKNNIEYVIYTYIYDHQVRMYSNLRSLVPNYKKDKNNNLIYYNENNFIDKSYTKNLITRLLANKLYTKRNPQDKNSSFQLLLTYIDEIYKAIENQFSYNNKPTKFIILLYNQMNNENWTLIKNKNITVINLEDLTNEDINKDQKYKVIDGHPSKEAWQVIVPALVKELNL